MKHLFAATAAILATLFTAQAEDAAATAKAVVIPVDSQAFVFSPGTWTGDDGRSGKQFRQTWNTGAYFRVSWESPAAKPEAKLLLDVSSYAGKCNPPRLSICVDGLWMSNVPCAEEIPLVDLRQGPGKHLVTVFLSSSEEKERWGSEGVSGANVLRVRGLQVDEGSKPLETLKGGKWILIVGDSITAGCGASELAPYSHLVGEAFRTRGYEYGVNACGWSGWLNKGDNPPGDVPGYYVVSGSTDGEGGVCNEAASRWNKLDGNKHSLLDAEGRLSAYGAKGQEPDVVLINYGTNDILHKSNPSDTRASIAQGLAALRKSAPDARIVVLIPFGQYYAKELKEAVEKSGDKKLSVIDLGPDAARSLTKNGAYGGLHPSDRGHANFAAQIIPQMMAIIDAK